MSADGLGDVYISGSTAGSLYGTNAGSNDVAVFAVHHDVLELVRTTPSNGGAPVSVTEHDSLVYVLNTGDPCLVGFTLDADGLHVLPGLVVTWRRARTRRRSGSPRTAPRWW